MTSIRRPDELDRLRVRLLREYGIDYVADEPGGKLYFRADRFHPRKFIGRARHPFDACELMIPIIRDDEFVRRFHRITNNPKGAGCVPKG